MHLSSHVTTNLDGWVENGFINIAQREAIALLMQGAVEDAYHAGCDDSENVSYDSGYDDGYQNGKDELESMRDMWFDQGWEAALTEHGIEE